MEEQQRDVETEADNEPILYISPFGFLAPNFTNAIANGTDLYDGNFTFTHDDNYFPGIGIFNPDAGATDINEHKVYAKAFDEKEFVKVAFLRENRHVSSMPIPFIMEKANNWIGKGLESIITTIREKTPLDPSLETSLTLERTTFNEEDEYSLKYLNVEEDVGQFDLKASTGKVPFGPFSIRSRWVTVGPYIELDIGFYTAYEYAEEKLFDENEFSPRSKSLEGGLSGGITAGISLEFGDSTITMGNTGEHGEFLDAGGGIVFNINLSASYPVEVKLKREWVYDEGSEEFESGCWIAEFNHGPASVNFILILRATLDLGEEYDITIFNVQHNWPLTDKVFNTCEGFPNCEGCNEGDD